MINFIFSPIGFFVLLSFFIAGALGSLIFQKNDRLANVWSGVFASAGSIWGLIFSSLLLLGSFSVSWAANSTSFSLLSVSFNIDKLSAFFIFVISLITLFCSFYGIGYVKHFYKRYNIGVLGLFFNLFIVGMLLVVSAANGIFWLIAWEIMSIASYFLVVYDRNDQENVRAGFLYLVMTHVGTVFIIISFFLLYKFTGSFDFSVVKANMALVPALAKDIIFVLALIGFGTKAGIIPFHIWLPAAHPAAPSHVSGLMSGVMIKTGIYMMIRIFLNMVQPIPVWWGVIILIIGSISALLGVLYAITEHDIKKLLAYHSIENIGIILLGLGSALAFSSLNLPTLALISLTAALFHTLNHAIFKSLLFLSAGSVINKNHTRNIEEYGGLIKFMPYTALFFLVGSMAISAMPPFNGFFSEWLTFQSLFQGIISIGSYVRWTFIISAGALAFTGGLALLCFAKAFGAIFLARPRSEEAKHATESSPWLLVGMGSLALLSLFFGLFSGPVISAIKNVSQSLVISSSAVSLVSVNSNQTISMGNFSSLSAPVFALIFVVVLTAVFLLVKYLIYCRQKVSVGATWDCGTDLTPRMEITSTSFARSIILIFKGVLRPRLHYDVKYHDSQSRYLPESRTVDISIKDIYSTYFYGPLSRFIFALSEKIKSIQNGNINSYILYIFGALLLVLFLVR